MFIKPLQKGKERRGKKINQENPVGGLAVIRAVVIAVILEMASQYTSNCSVKMQ